MYTFGKGLSGGNCPIGAIGMTEEFAKLIQSRKVQVAGTYYGNSYALGLAHAVLKYVSEEKQAELER
jgi:acetylornithine/succinyldiaminopimelate/putrescine aminotransferase